jgi:serine protease Do
MVLPSVVTIESFGGVSSARGRMQGLSRPGDGPTTGLIVSEDGYVITSTFNFLRNPPIITVVTRDGQRHLARMLGRDETRKLCLLKIDSSQRLPAPKLAPQSQLRVGQWAIAVGVGYGDPEPAVSAGIISAHSRISGRAVQTDANISPANYGGPLLDIDGQVIGICVPLSPQSGDVSAGSEWYDSGIGFAIPLEGADDLLAALKEGKTILPAYLGVQVKAADAPARGAVVAQVLNDSPAERAGLKADDVLIAADGQAIRDPADLRVMIGRRIAGQRIKLLIERAAEQQEFEITLGDRAAAKTDL